MDSSRSRNYITSFVERQLSNINAIYAVDGVDWPLAVDVCWGRSGVRWWPVQTSGRLLEAALQVGTRAWGAS